MGSKESFMKILLEITEKDLGFSETERFDKPYQLRKAARAILIREDGKVAIQNVAHRGFHKIPGGGIDLGENIEQALRREIREESGCEIEIGDPLGMIVEYRNWIDLIQISYCFLAKVVGDIHPIQLTESEIADGMQSLWFSLEEAIAILSSENPEDKEAQFIVKRDLAFLRAAKEILERK